MKTNYPCAFAVNGIKRILAGLVLAAGVILTQPVMAAGSTLVDLEDVGASLITKSAIDLMAAGPAPVNGTIDAVDNTGSAGSVMDLVIKANGSNNDISINSGANLSISVQINLGEYPKAYVNWWIVARVNSSWYYLNSSMQWMPTERNLLNCHPVYQGYLFNLPETQVWNTTGLPVGVYTFWFAVDQTKWIWIDSVNVTVQ